MDSYKFEGGEISLIENNVILIEYESSQQITTQTILNLTKLRKRLLGNQPFYTITDARNGHLNLSDDAKQFLSKESNATKIRFADAILINKLAQRIEVELYILFNKPKVKTKSFKELNNAICWINDIKAKITKK